MSLIQCIECGNKVSDKASTCPHCGCPVSESLNTLIKKSNKDKVFYKCPLCGAPYEKGDIKCSICGYTSIMDQKENKTLKPHCPYCNSTNIKKIGIGGRALSAWTLGLAGSKIGKQWHCNNCKSDF